MEIFKIIGKRLREERLRSGITQERLAELAGISNNFVSYIESGRKVASVKTLKKLCDALAVPISDIFREIPQETRYATDSTARQLSFILRDSPPAKRRLMLRVCKSILAENK